MTNSSKKLLVACVIGAATALASGSASAITTNTVDESTSTFTFDYTSLAPLNQNTEATPGDVVLCDGPCDVANPVISDIIQFRPGNDLLDVFMTVTIFSDDSDTDPGGSPAADTGLWPRLTVGLPRLRHPPRARCGAWRSR